MVENQGNFFSSEDFLQRIYFSKEIFWNGNLFDVSQIDFENENKFDVRERRRKVARSRGPDRQPRKRRPWLLEERKHLEILDLLRAGYGKRLIARRVGCGLSAVQVRAAIVRREDDQDGDVDFRMVREEVCEVHGPVSVWPCVQCLAEAAAEKRREEIRKWHRERG